MASINFAAMFGDSTEKIVNNFLLKINDEIESTLEKIAHTMNPTEILLESFMEKTIEK